MLKNDPPLLPMRCTTYNVCIKIYVDHLYLPAMSIVNIFFVFIILSWNLVLSMIRNDVLCMKMNSENLMFRVTVGRPWFFCEQVLYINDHQPHTFTQCNIFHTPRVVKCFFVRLIIIEFLVSGMMRNDVLCMKINSENLMFRVTIGRPWFFYAQLLYINDHQPLPK